MVKVPGHRRSPAHGFGVIRIGRLLSAVIVIVTTGVFTSGTAQATPQPMVRATQLSPGITANGLTHVGVLPRVGNTPIPGEDPDPARWVHGLNPNVPGVSDSSLVSGNWAGWVDTGTTYLYVIGDWTVPSVPPSASPKYAATWIGIGGVGSTRLVQTGTAEDTSGDVTSYSAWVELLPAGPVSINASVDPGDEMRAEILRSTQDSDIWTILIEDLTENWFSDPTVTYTAGPAASAEWITERPVVNTSLSTLANFGSSRFTDVTTYGPNFQGTSLSPAYMINTIRQIIAYPNQLVSATGGDFTDYYGTPQPTVTSVSPSQGGTGGGTSVSILGTYLVPDLVESVAFGTESVPFSVGPSGVTTATAPSEAAGTVNVRVTTTDGISAPSPSNQFTYVAPSPSPPPPPPPPPAAPLATTSGYDMVGSDGGVFVFPAGQSGGYYGSLPGDNVHVSNVVGMVPTPSDTGYFLVGSDGGVFAFGDAPYLGSLPGDHVSVNDVRAIVPTSDNRGYFLVGADGGVFTFGDAPFLGSLPGSGIHVANVVGIAATPNDEGYWLVTSTGHVYSYGNAFNWGPVTGSASPVSGIDSTPDGGGYWVVTQNGGIYTFGDASYFGSLPGMAVTPSKPIIGLVPTANQQGYWLIGSDGGIFAFGDASFQGSLPQLGVDVTDVVGAVPTKT